MSSPGHNDPVLVPLIRADDQRYPEEVEHLLAVHVRPLLARVLGRYTAVLSEADAEDVAATVDLRVLEKLRRVREGPGDAIEDFASYVAMMAYNAVNDFLRARYPRRARLKTRTRYVLAHDPRLALWTTPAGPACGLAAWKESPASHDASLGERVSGVMRDADRPADAIAAVLRAIGRPVLLDALVDVLADLWQIVDAPPGGLALVEPAQSAQRDAGEELESRQYLRALWSEIRELRPMQRQALLLNLRDQQTVDAIQLLLVTGTATFDELASAVEMTPEELAELWNELPLDDLRIAARLQVTRQQVINLRKSARARLGRRMGR
ncbi:MAG TPA: sigma factor [Thermoanaerobaculia bacterium]|nr:sigma factor [Thermoanaerobaculia bacterium]